MQVSLLGGGLPHEAFGIPGALRTRVLIAGSLEIGPAYRINRVPATPPAR